MKIMYFDSFEEYSNCEPAKEYETVAIIREGGWIKADVCTECKRGGTALNRFFKAVANIPELADWAECVKESVSNGYYKDSNRGMADSTVNPDYSYAWSLEDYDGVWYFFLNVKVEEAQEAQEAQEASKGESVQDTQEEPAQDAQKAQEAPAEKPVKALRSNSKRARENIRNYILDYYTGGSAGYDGAPEEGCRNFPEVARFIWKTFQEEKRYSAQYMHRYGADWQTLFNDWCRGLPSVLDTCFCYNRPAVPEVAGILQQDEKQSSKYTETAAEDFLIYLIYREITREVK